jgi:tRNA (mo5U34)-methyltransferase
MIEQQGMKVITRMIKSALHQFGWELLKVNISKCPRFPIPSSDLVNSAADMFSDSFPIAAKSGFSQTEIEAGIQDYEWFYHFDFGGKQVGPNPGAPKEGRGHYQRYLHIFPAILSLTGGTLAGQRILDIGCNAGFWSIQAARFGAASLLGIDSSEKNIDQARFVAKLIGLDNLEYCVKNTYDITKTSLGEFDITFFFGVLYHLDNPVFALQRLYDVTKKFAVIDTQLTNADMAMLRMDNDTASRYHAQSHTNTLALIPSESAVLFMLQSVGFREVFLVSNQSRNLPDSYLTGTWGTFIAVK